MASPPTVRVLRRAAVSARYIWCARTINWISTPATVALRDPPEQSPIRAHVPAQVEDPLARTGGEDASEASARSRLLTE